MGWQDWHLEGGSVSRGMYEIGGATVKKAVYDTDAVADCSWVQLFSDFLGWIDGNYLILLLKLIYVITFNVKFSVVDKLLILFKQLLFSVPIIGK